MIFLRGFLEDNRRFLWLPAVPSQAAIYYDDLPRRDKPRPRFVPEAVMAQLEAEANLAQLDPTTRNLVVLLIEAGLRAGDACTLAFDPLVPDSVGWPCLRFHNSKVGLEQVVPLSAKGVAAVRGQQDVVRQRWPAGSPWLFPDLLDNPDGSQPYRYLSLGRRLRAWELRIGLHDEAGRPIRVTAHQLRHTLGSRLINAGVPQHVVQRVLGHYAGDPVNSQTCVRVSRVGGAVRRGGAAGDLSRGRGACGSWRCARRSAARRWPG